MRGYSVLTGSMLSKEINGYSPELDVLPEYDVEKARALMKEAGYEDGFSVTLDCTNDRYMQDEALCIALGSMMTQIGIRVTVRAQTVGKWAEQVNPPTYNTSFTMVGYSPSSADAHNVLTTLVATRDPDRSMGVFNIGGYSNPKVDDLTAAIQIETNPTKRNDLILQAFRLIGEDAAYVPLQQLVLLWAAGKNVDLVQMPDDRLMLSHVTVN
jgi:peptide/nickel transport system substrate-binding protein